MSYIIASVFGVGIRSGLFIYIFRQFFKGMPKELEEAAYLDGCGPIATFFRIMLVNAGAAVLITFLISFVWYWNDYYTTSLYFNDIFSLNGALANLSATLRSVGINSWVDPYSIVTQMQAGCLLVILPMLIIYIFLQRLFTEAIDKTGIVG